MPPPPRACCGHAHAHRDEGGTPVADLVWQPDVSDLRLIEGVNSACSLCYPASGK